MVGLAIASTALLMTPWLITALQASNNLFDRASVPQNRVAIVFGAGLQSDGTPTRVLRDRVGTAAQLYFDGKVQALLLSGDNRFVDYNEPAAMREYALGLGVPEEALVLDFAGRRTYDTCYRAREVFQLNAAVLVTQDFHLPRALYTCNALGVESAGVPAERTFGRRSTALFWRLREFPATVRAFWDLYIIRPTPVLGEPIPIWTMEGT